MCNHTYWNLSGDFKNKNIKGHRLELFCDKYLPMNEELLPSGALEPVDDTPFDMRRGDYSRRAPFITGMDRFDGAIEVAGEYGLDHQFLIERPEGTSGDGILRECARLIHTKSAREMKVSTTQNCLGVYTSNHLPKAGTNPDDGFHTKHAAVCLETSQFNDAVNKIGKAGWPSEE